MPEGNPPVEIDSPPSAPKVLALIETDVYCESCGYNLRTQPVWRDERLGVIVCRCPECGAHRAAGIATVGSLWGRRLATGLLVVWIILCVAGVLGAAGITLAMQQEAGGIFTYANTETRDGATVRSYNLNGQLVYWPAMADIDFRLDQNNQYKAYLLPAQTEVSMNGPPFLKPTDLVLRYHAADWMTGRPHHEDGYNSSSSQWQVALVFAGATGVLAGLFGVIMACVCWHWARRRRWVWVLMPLLTLTVSLGLARTTPHRWMPTLPTDREHLFDLAVLAVAMLQVLAIGVGLWTGRMIVRWLVRLFVPRLARTPLSFLWTADNKPLPRAVI